MSRCNIGNGSFVCFWEDRWVDQTLSTKYPRLASFSRNTNISVHEVMQTVDLDTLFFLPLSQQALEDLISLQQDVQEVPFENNEQDAWLPFGRSEYTAKRFYKHIYEITQAHPTYKIIWKAQCTPRVKFFIWLILVDRLTLKPCSLADT